MRRLLVIVLVLPSLLLVGSGQDAFSQGKLYTARGYWEESTKTTYLDIKQKVDKGDSLTENERNYLQDYEVYLRNYFLRMSQDDKDDYDRLKVYWDGQRDAQVAPLTEAGEFEWRARDRIANGLYGLFYGASIASITDAKGAAVAGVPLITAGLWMLGPAINPKKYENITRRTVRANNTGKLLGLGYGAALGLLLAGNSQDARKWTSGFATLGSIVLGEMAFYGQQKKNYSSGHIELVRHYGFLGPWIGLASAIGTGGSSSANGSGGAILAGGVAGLVIGNQVAKKYDYSRGDVDAISSLTLISTGLGFAAATESVKSNSDVKSLIFIPAATSIAATIWGQRQIKGAHLTDKQGSTINFSTAGAAILGLGTVALTESKSAAVWLGVPSGLALITHQLLFHKYKMKNLETNLRGSLDNHSKVNVSLKVTPESYFLNQRIPAKEYSPEGFARLQNPVFKLVITF